MAISERINELKRQILKMSYESKEGHIPSAFSILDILYVLYNKIMSKDDRFILSKGHGSMALYVVLADKGLLHKEELDTFCQFNSNLGGHPDSNKIEAVIASTGSLGHGMPMAVGVAMALKIKKNIQRVYTLVGDGECNEGSIWEAAMIASHQGLTNLTCIVDYNRSTDRALPIDDISAKFQAFGWYVFEIDGHDHDVLSSWLGRTHPTKPVAIICNTIKGKGIKRLENNPAWHHRYPTDLEYEEMLTEL
jgi:transketolase